MTLARYAIAAVLVLVGLVWVGQGIGMIGGSSMTGQPIFAVLGVVLVVLGGALAWRTSRTTSP